MSIGRRLPRQTSLFPYTTLFRSLGERVGDDGAADAREARAGEASLDADEERADAVDGRLGLRERRGLVVERRAVVRRPEQVAHGQWRGQLEEVARVDRVAERLRHLLPAHVDEPVVHPVAREGLAVGGGLGELVLVVREAQVEPAAV